MKSTEIDWQDGQDGRVSVITLLLNNYLNIFLHPFLFRTTKNQVKEYNKNPTSTPLLTESTVSVVPSVGTPIDPAIATVVVLYIHKVGINIFCEYIMPEESKKTS